MICIFKRHVILKQLKKPHPFPLCVIIYVIFILIQRWILHPQDKCKVCRSLHLVFLFFNSFLVQAPIHLPWFSTDFVDSCYISLPSNLNAYYNIYFLLCRSYVIYKYKVCIWLFRLIRLVNKGFYKTAFVVLKFKQHPMVYCKYILVVFICFLYISSIIFVNRLTP